MSFTFISLLVIGALQAVLALFGFLVEQQIVTQEVNAGLIRLLANLAGYTHTNWVPLSVVLIIIYVSGVCYSIIRQCDQLRQCDQRRSTLSNTFLLLLNLLLCGKWYEMVIAQRNLNYLNEHLPQTILLLIALVVVILFAQAIRKARDARREREMSPPSPENRAEGEQSASAQPVDDFSSRHPFSSVWDSFKRYYAHTRRDRYEKMTQYKDAKHKRLLGARKEKAEARGLQVEASAQRKSARAVKRQAKYVAQINAYRLAMGQPPLIFLEQHLQCDKSPNSHDGDDSYTSISFPLPNSGALASWIAGIAVVVFVILWIVFGTNSELQWLRFLGETTVESLKLFKNDLHATINNLIPSINGFADGANRLSDAIVGAILAFGGAFLLIIAILLLYFVFYFLIRVCSYFSQSRGEDFPNIQKFGQAFKVFFFDAADDVMRMLLFIPDFLFQIEELLVGVDSIEDKISERFPNRPNTNQGGTINGGQASESSRAGIHCAPSPATLTTNSDDDQSEEE